MITRLPVTKAYGETSKSRRINMERLASPCAAVLISVWLQITLEAMSPMPSTKIRGMSTSGERSGGVQQAGLLADPLLHLLGEDARELLEVHVAADRVPGDRHVESHP